ncbi:MAG: folate-binding protein [Paracoccaceae bacterium]|nr:folate-binding protein [Paracoccaceae bacterium]
MSARTVLKVTGDDREDFLQNLVTNDVGKLADGLVWAALLTPQGKYLADFFLVPADDAILIDVAETLAPDLLKRLTMYRLRAAVQIEATDTPVARGLGPAPDGAFQDPRDPALGWRAYDGRASEDVDWNALRVAHLVPASGEELLPGESYPLEMNFEALNGVDFKKGCYVGQEVTARMKHKTELRKGLARVRIQGQAAPGTDILNDKGAKVGTLFTQSGEEALAYLRFDRANGPMTADQAKVELANA